ncbi:MAG: hypothetical protein ACOVOV_01265 [Dolichospermum sp.]
MFFFKLLKYSVIAGISFNVWSLFWQACLKFPSIFPAYWSLLIVFLLLHLGLMTEAAQEKISEGTQEPRTDLAIANFSAFFSCLFAAVGAILGVIF